ncbi:MAG: hypothetical protein SGARI_000172 [Bacillariaceae sp.]
MADADPTTTDAPAEETPQETNAESADVANGDAAAAAPSGDDAVTGSTALRPVFLGNLKPNYLADDIMRIFEQPVVPPGTEDGTYKPIPVDRLDQKRGYCFVFLKDAIVQDDKDNAEKFVAAITE